MRHIIDDDEKFCGSIEEDMFFPDIPKSKTINDTYYPEKKCAYSDRNGKCILGNDYNKCTHKKSDNTCGYTNHEERIPIINSGIVRILKRG